jgi:hypothetical protein
MIALKTSRTASPSVVTASKQGLPFAARVAPQEEKRRNFGQVALVELYHRGRSSTFQSIAD